MRCDIRVDEDLVTSFAALTGDRSAIHIDPEFARKTRFRGIIVHGMLPVILLVSRIAAETPSGGALRLRALTCRFTAAVKPGDWLHLEAEPRMENSSEIWSFAIMRRADGVKVTSGRIEFADGGTSAPPAGHAGPLPIGLVEENRSLLGDLKVGGSEDLTFHVDPTAARPLLDALAKQLGNREHGTGDLDDAGAMAAAMASTLVGMRLPGRYATFLDLDVVFPEPIARDSLLTLRGTVSDIAPTGSRMRLDLRWLRSSEAVGHGSASTMIGTEPAASLACADIRRDHSASGIAGRVALVTGSSRGIGEATAKLLAMQGARVAVHYFRGRGDAEAIVADIRANGGQAVAVQADIADEASVEALFTAVETALGPVDILVNNAVGDFNPKPFDDLRPEDYLAELGISLFGLHTCCRRALGHMRRQRWGKIVNLGTVATELPAASQTRYIAVKSAVVGHTRSLAVETAADNVQVNMVVPAMTDTSLIAGLPRALVERLAEDSPSGTLLQPIDVAKTILFLASDWSGSISGQQILLTRGAPPFL